MTTEDALSLHNAFRRSGRWYAAHTFSCVGAPTDDLLTFDNVYLLSPGADWIAKISESNMLRSLAIKNPATDDLRPIGKLALLQFEVSYPTRVKDWRFLSQLTNLRRLFIDNTTTFSDLSCLEEMRAVEFLGITGGYSKPLRADSLRPLAAMSALRAIFLANVRFGDWDLSSLRLLTRLELLHTPKWCPAKEVALVRQQVPALAWNWDQNGMKGRPNSEGSAAP